MAGRDALDAAVAAQAGRMLFDGQMDESCESTSPWGVVRRGVETAAGVELRGLNSTGRAFLLCSRVGDTQGTR